MTDVALMGWVSALIEEVRLKWMLGAGQPWHPGRKLRLLFAGYNGTRNTGSDLRVEEMLRQVRHVLGEDKLELSVMSQNFAASRGYFGDARQVHLPDVYPPFLYREVPQHDGVVACEGSMFKSKFANALTVMMIGSLGMAAAENKLSVGYGAEAGAMDPLLAGMCRRYCRDSFIITRNEESRGVLSGLGVASELGTDTAWTFEPLPPDYGRAALRAAGWDERQPVLVVCPINPFWWPVKPSVAKLAARTLFGAWKDSQYRTIYFHTYGPERRAAYRRYLSAMAGAVKAFSAERRMFPIVVAMERLDARACLELARELGGAPVFTSDEQNMYQLISLIRCADVMVSSRYHAMVTTMPALVPSAGVTMDERIRNLMRDRGQEDFLLEVDDAELEDKLLVVMRKLEAERDRVVHGMGRAVVRNLKLM
ncbi:MAG: polysaccharide pyruvyl transferase family protein, partial [Acidobacteria bacterium]|nr:polysaccharide pyruvyl transferase family protein [Acidobacteriota bacterium]